MITMKKSKDRKPEQQVDLEYVSAARIQAQILPCSRHKQKPITRTLHDRHPGRRDTTTLMTYGLSAIITCRHLTLHLPSMHTFFRSVRQGVPSLTLGRSLRKNMCPFARQFS